MHVPHIPLRREPAAVAEAGTAQLPAPVPKVQALTEVFEDFLDPRLREFLRDGYGTNSGATVNVHTALRNTTVFRCVSLISYAMGMLPLHLLRGGDDFDSNKATDHPLYRVLYRKPNAWQTAFDFRSHLQLNALVHGNGYAKVARSGKDVVALLPLSPEKTKPVQRPDASVQYEYTRPDGGKDVLKPEDVLHIRALSLDALCGMSLVRQAAEAIGLANQMEAAAGRAFRNGMLVGGAFTHPGKLSPTAKENLIESMTARYAGVENAHKWMVLEEGLKAEKIAQTAEEAQHLEMRKLQIEEIGRIFGVPRPLLGVDDTSWGTGIEQLGIGFVRYALNPWFQAWEQAISRTLLTEREQDEIKPKFNEGALLRGSMKDQADFFAKALGAGGHAPWMTVDEVRGLANLSKKGGDAEKLGQPGLKPTPPKGMNG